MGRSEGRESCDGVLFERRIEKKSKRKSPRHITVKTTSTGNKENVLKFGSKTTQNTYKENPSRINA